MIRRLYDPNNIHAILRFARGMHAKSALAGIPIDARRADSLLRGAFMSSNGAVWASYHEKQVAGVLIGAILDWDYLVGQYATDVVFIATHHGAALYRAFEQWALARKVNAIQMGVSSGVGRAGQLYEKFGMAKVGGVYFKDFSTSGGG
jgi:hypothetical protein